MNHSGDGNINQKEPVVQIKQLTKTIGKKKIIDNITFDIFPGEVFGFLGPNGAGKTTTIRMMVGLMSVTSGDIIIKGNSIRSDFVRAIEHVGGIVENPEMYKFLTGYQNLVHYARMSTNLPKSNRTKRIKEVIELVGLEKRIHDKVKTYSLGMRQRLGLAQALLHSPRLLILDEPTNGLDPAGIREIRDYLRKLAREEGLSIMVSSHLLSEMELMCDRIGIIQQGQLIDVKTMTDFINDEQHTYEFIVDNVSESMTLLQEHFPQQELIQTGETIHILIEKEYVPDVAALLVQNNIKLYGIQKVSKSLEDRFLEVTGGKQIV